MSRVEYSLRAKRSLYVTRQALGFSSHFDSYITRGPSNLLFIHPFRLFHSRTIAFSNI